MRRQPIGVKFGQRKGVTMRLRCLLGILHRHVILTSAVLLLAGPSFAQKPDAELRGITVVGVEVEDVSAQAAACGLSREAIQSTVTKALTEGGLKVTRNADTDVYLYVNVNTVSPAAGVCVSRYDASLNTNITAKLPYQDQSALVQVVLIHEGGMASGGASGHGDGVVKTLKQYVDQFALRIRRASL
jgi:hypothetical protein